MPAMPYTETESALGFTETLDEAKQAANEIFAEWLESSGLKIAPPAKASGAECIGEI
jgi:predicted RNase H-like HicB family nuclease